MLGTTASQKTGCLVRAANTHSLITGGSHSRTACTIAAPGTDHLLDSEEEEEEEAPPRGEAAEPSAGVPMSWEFHGDGKNGTIVMLAV
jgi:hypothetical protein